MLCNFRVRYALKIHQLNMMNKMGAWEWFYKVLLQIFKLHPQYKKKVLPIYRTMSPKQG